MARCLLACALAVLAVLVCSCEAATVKYLGFYAGNYTLNQGFTNTFMADNFVDAQLARQAGQMAHLRLDYFLVDVSTDPKTGKNLKALKPNWKDLWNGIAQQAGPMLGNGTLEGFFLGDELVCHGIPNEDLHHLADTVKNTFPNAFVWANECHKTPCDDSFTLPTGLDAFSVDMYHFDGKETDWVRTNVKQLYQTCIYPKLKDHQHVLVVPGSYGSNINPKCNMACYVDMLSYDIQQYTEWAKNDEKVVGLIPWTWGSCGTYCDKFMDEVGTEAIPGLIAAWKTAYNNLFGTRAHARRA